MCFAESVDVKDRGRCDSTAEAGLPAAAGQELLPVAGVFTDMTPRTQLHIPLKDLLAVCTATVH